jgi:phosphotransferase system HPr (HPr) family protein
VITREFVMRNPSGLHARPATVFVQLCARLTSTVEVENLDRPGRAANGRSILDVLTLGVGPGQRIRVSVVGPNEESDLSEIEGAIESGLGEGAVEAG